MSRFLLSSRGFVHADRNAFSAIRMRIVLSMRFMLRRSVKKRLMVGCEST